MILGEALTNVREQIQRMDAKKGVSWLTASNDGSGKFDKQQLILMKIGGQTVGIGRQSPFGSRNYSVPVPLLTQSSENT